MREKEDVFFQKRRLLHEAVCNGNMLQLRYLLDKRGEDVNGREGKQRKTALMVSVTTKYASTKMAGSILNLLLKASPDLNAVDDAGCTALIHACKTNNFQAVRLLVTEYAHDLCLDAKDCDGMTSLMYAVRNNNFKMIEVLLSPWIRFGLSLTQENKFGENVMDIAMVETDHRICDLLRKHGFCAQNPLSWAVKKERAKTTPFDHVTKKRQEFASTRRVKSCFASLYNRDKKNKICDLDMSKSPSVSCTSSSSRSSRQNEQLRHIFDLYSEQLTPSFKVSAVQEHLDDRDDAASIDSLASVRSFRSVGYRPGSHEEFTDPLFQKTPLRSRKSGAGLIVPTLGRTRKASAPCFPSNPMFKATLLKRRIAIPKTNFTKMLLHNNK